MRAALRVRWVREQMNVALAVLYQKVDDLCNPLGLRRETRLFAPRDASGRVRRAASPADLRRDRSIPMPLLALISYVRTFDPTASERSASRMRHGAVASATLRGAAESC